MTPVEKTILALIVIDDVLLAEREVASAIDRVDSRLAQAVELARVAPDPSVVIALYDLGVSVSEVKLLGIRQRKSLMLKSLSGWFEHKAVEYKLLSEDLSTAAVGSAKDLVAQMRAVKPMAKRRTGGRRARSLG